MPQSRRSAVDEEMRFVATEMVGENGRSPQLKHNAERAVQMSGVSPADTATSFCYLFDCVGQSSNPGTGVTVMTCTRNYSDGVMTG
jgi:hypothetical protein